MLKYEQFLFETKMSYEKEDFHLELNNLGKLLEPFLYYYRPQLHDNYYFVLKRIPYNEYTPQNNRVTLLGGTIYKDTDSYIVKRQLGNTNFNQNNYYFYKLVSTRRRHQKEPHGTSISYKEEPNRFNDQLTRDGNLHFIVIKHNSIVYSVRLNGGQRSAAGDSAERVIAGKFRFTIDQTKISKKIKKKVLNGIIPPREGRSILFDILGTEENLFNEYEDLFEFENPSEVLNKYDLIIPDGELIGKKIEVKKYNISALFDRNGNRKSIEMAEQLKIGDKQPLKKLVDLYHRLNPNVDVTPLIGNYDTDRGVELNNLFGIRATPRNQNNLVNNIRNFYNRRIEYMYEKYRRIPNDLIMRDIYGVYFFHNEYGIDGFFIKSVSDGIKNFEYNWELVNAQWGLKRIKLMFKVDPDAIRMIWLGDERIFIETFRVGDKIQAKALENMYLEYQKNKSLLPIIRNTEVGPVKWSSNDGYWVRMSEEEIREVGGVGMVIRRKNKSISK